MNKNIKTITGIHGVPRSGTSWLAQIFNASPKVALKFQPLFSYAFKDYLNGQSTSKDIIEFFNQIYRSDDYFINMQDKDIHKNYPVFKKEEPLEHLVFKHVRYHYLIEHLLKNNTQIKFILIIRNPLSVLASWYKAPREFRADLGWDIQEEWRKAPSKNLNKPEEYNGFEKWKEATNLFIELQNKYPDRIKVVKYIDLLQNTHNASKSLFNFCGIEFHQQVIDFIYKSKSKTDNDPNSVFKQKPLNDDSWKTVLPDNIVHEIMDDLKNTPFEQYL
jgi:hypothetical protein